MQYRGFGYAHARVLLALQYEIVNLEKQLDKLDRWDASDGAGDDGKLYCIAADEVQALPNDIHGFPFSKTRPQILGELSRKLLEYGMLSHSLAKPHRD